MDSVRSAGKGVKIADTNIDLLMYADDVVVIGETENDLQVMLNSIDNWCKTWGICINVRKTKVLHFRLKRAPLSSFKFNLGIQPIEYAHEYKYLGFLFNEFLDLENSTQRVFESGNQVLAALIAKTKLQVGFLFQCLRSYIMLQ